MGLEITRNKDGSPRSKCWYGNFTVGGNRKYINLGVEICGSVPASLKETGDVAFERSRMKAQLKLDALKQDAHSRKTAAHHLQELYEIKAGEEISQIPLTDMEEQWEFLPAKRRRSSKKLRSQKAHIKQCREFLATAFPQAKVMSQVYGLCNG